MKIVKVCKSLKERCIALKVYYPRNASNYGMLGLRFIPSEDNEVIIKIFVSTDNNVKFDNSLVSGSDEIYLEIDPEYSEIILESEKKYILANEVSFPGVVEFCYGTYSIISSSPIVFSKLTTLLLGIVSLQIIDKKIIEQYIFENM